MANTEPKGCVGQIYVFAQHRKNIFFCQQRIIITPARRADMEFVHAVFLHGVSQANNVGRVWLNAPRCRRIALRIQHWLCILAV